MKDIIDELSKYARSPKCTDGTLLAAFVKGVKYMVNPVIDPNVRTLEQFIAASKRYTIPPAGLNSTAIRDVVRDLTLYVSTPDCQDPETMRRFVDCLDVWANPPFRIEDVRGIPPEDPTNTATIIGRQGKEMLVNTYRKIHLAGDLSGRERALETMHYLVQDITRYTGDNPSIVSAKLTRLTVALCYAASSPKDPQEKKLEWYVNHAVKFSLQSNLITRADVADIITVLTGYAATPECRHGDGMIQFTDCLQRWAKPLADVGEKGKSVSADGRRPDHVVEGVKVETPEGIEIIADPDAFDHPTDLLTPGGKVIVTVSKQGFGKRVGPVFGADLLETITKRLGWDVERTGNNTLAVNGKQVSVRVARTTYHGKSKQRSFEFYLAEPRKAYDNPDYIVLVCLSGNKPRFFMIPLGETLGLTKIKITVPQRGTYEGKWTAWLDRWDLLQPSGIKDGV